MYFPFLYCTIGVKDPPNPAAPIVRCFLKEYSGYPISSGNAGKGIERQRAIAIRQSVSSFSNVAKTQYEKKKKRVLTNRGKVL